MQKLNIIALIFSWIALPGLALLGYVLSDEGLKQDSPYYLLFAVSALMFLAFIFVSGYVQNSGRTRLIPETVYFLAMAVNYKVMNEQMELSFVKVLLLGIIILSLICRVISFILSWSEYHSDKEKSKRRIARADYDYETAKFNYEYEVKYGTNYGAQKLAEEELDIAKQHRRRVHNEEDVE